MSDKKILSEALSFASIISDIGRRRHMTLRPFRVPMCSGTQMIKEMLKNSCDIGQRSTLVYVK